jgi:hypothetical protein
MAATMANDDDRIVLVGLDVDRLPYHRLRDVPGSFREHGVPGFAYLNRVAAGYRYDDKFVWWGGDDDLVWTVLRDGRRAVVAEGCWVIHPVGGNTTGRHYPELGVAIGGDRERLLAKWGKAW